MNLSYTLLITSTILFSACSSTPPYTNGKNFTFDDKELEMKLVYSCQDKPELESVNIRAKNANEYFKKVNTQNTDMLIQETSNGTDRGIIASNMQKRTENLAANLDKKFSCTLIDTIDY